MCIYVNDQQQATCSKKNEKNEKGQKNLSIEDLKQMCKEIEECNSLKLK
jgi:hypothetical protein